MSSIVEAVIHYYRDNQMYQGEIVWSGGTQTSGTIYPKNSCFLMRPSSMEMGEHLESLFARAEREGIKYQKKIW